MESDSELYVVFMSANTATVPQPVDQGVISTGNESF